MHPEGRHGWLGYIPDGVGGVEQIEIPRRSIEAQPGAVQRADPAIPIPYLDDAAILQSLLLVSSGALVVIRQDGHPHHEATQPVVAIPFEEVLNYPVALKTLRSGRGQQGHQPHCIDGGIEGITEDFPIGT